jgi:nickel superoxide dismutase
MAAPEHHTMEAYMSRAVLGSVTLAVLGLLAGRAAYAHCQVPCGIYDDHARVHAIREDVATITKAVTEMGTLASKNDAQSKQQFVRWVMTKEAHAEKIIRTISDYFLAQKIAPAPAKDRKAHAAYVEKLTKHHAVMVAAMKCKQSAALDAVKALTKALDEIEGYWPEKK